MSGHLFDDEHLSIERIVNTVRAQEPVHIPDQWWQTVAKCRQYLDDKLHETDQKYYGVNTGFGALADVRISNHELGQLQGNLVVSHAAGVGNEVPTDIVRLMLLLKIKSLLYGYSGVSKETIERLQWHYNEDVLPVVYEMGSLGASGDLAPLAHLSLPLIGYGEVWHNGKKKQTGQVLEASGLKPISLKAKEGLSLLNGTQFMTAYGCLCLKEAKTLLNWADGITAVSIDGFMAKTEPFHPLIHQIRNSWRQKQVAHHILSYLKGSAIADLPKEQVQDPYSFRCVPQVHGASREAVEHVHKVFEEEINAVTDNPNVFPDEDEILSGGNFHGERLAMALDYLAVAMSEIGSISERRIYKLLSGAHSLPAFLVAEPGLNSGLMIPQYTAASLVSQNRQLCTPASADSITSSNGQEDHVSMGANAALKAYQVIQNLKTILAIELMTATQALDFRKPRTSGALIEQLRSEYRKHVSFIEHDREMHTDIKDTEQFMQNRPDFFNLTDTNQKAGS